MKMYNLDTSNRVKYEDLNNIEQSVFEDVYREADKTLYKIVEDGQKYKTKDEKDQDSLNVISFLGERGRGKTSAMLSFLAYLNVLQTKCSWSKFFQEKKSNMPEIRFVTLPYIDAAMLAENEYIVDVILAEMWDKFEKAIRKNLYDVHDGSCTEHQEQKIKEAFIKVRKSYLEMKEREKDSVKDGEKDIPMPGALHELATSVNLRCELQSLSKLYLDYFGAHDAGGAKETYLVIPIDDVDMSSDKAYSVLEQIRRFLRIEHVIVSATADIDRLQRACESRYQTIYLDEVDRAHFVNEYLEKVLPYNMRVYMPELMEKQGVILIETKAREVLNLKSTNEKDMIMEFMAKECGIYFDGGWRRRHFLQNHSMRSMVNYFEQLIRISDMQNYKISWLKIDLKERLAERITNMRHKRFFMNLLQKDYEDLNITCLNYMIPYIVEKGGQKPIYDESIGQVLYICNQMTKVDTESDNLVNCIIMLYSIALKEVDEELKNRLIGNSILGQWEYGAFTRGLTEQRREVQMFSDKMKLELDVTEIIDNEKSVADNTETILRANWSYVLAWLYAGLFITTDCGNIDAVYQYGITRKNDKLNSDKKEELFRILPVQYAVKSYFKALYQNEQEKDLIREKLRHIIILVGRLVNTYLGINEGKLSEKEITRISKIVYPSVMTKKREAEKNELSVEVLYSIGQTLDNNSLPLEMRTVQIRFLERRYLTIQNQLDRVENYYKKLGIDFKVGQQFKRTMQSRLLSGMISMTTEEREEFENRIGTLLNEIQGTTITAPRE